MAEIINLRQNEYQTIITEVTNMHTNQLQNVANVIAALRNLVTSTETFSVELTSKKIADMLDMLSKDAISLLQQVFQDSEAGVANMITSTMVTDSACD